jgi:hypothetical protein
MRQRIPEIRVRHIPGFGKQPSVLKLLQILDFQCPRLDDPGFNDHGLNHRSPPADEPGCRELTCICCNSPSEGWPAFRHLLAAAPAPGRFVSADARRCDSALPLPALWQFLPSAWPLTFALLGADSLVFPAVAAEFDSLVELPPMAADDESAEDEPSEIEPDNGATGSCCVTPGVLLPPG